MSADETLESYKQKRDFAGTREPAPAPEASRWGALTFVVQKHAARRLHYDVRLEIDGVLKSWPVPKGPSLDPHDKRLAVMVEDHPLDYAGFEGVIGHGNYGAGQVIVWDAGVYSPDEGGRLSFNNREEAEERMLQGLEDGKLSFALRGRKMRGSWTLVKTARGPRDWLLIKHRDGYADPDRDILEDDRSVVSGLTIAELKAGRLPDLSRAARSDMGRPGSFPSKLKPALARIGRQPFSHPDWLFEPKLDGFRVLAFVQRGRVTLRSRNAIDLTEHFPGVVEELQSQPEEELVLDGEVVALDERGLPSFGLLQQSSGIDEKGRRRRSDGSAPIVYYPFDLLHLNGRNIQKLPLSQRKALLSSVLIPGDAVQLVEHVEADGERFFDAAVELGLEGMVAKRKDGRYEPGVRARSWLKVKAEQSQELVVGGYTAGSGARESTFGALLVGYYEDGKLRYAGRVGSGFDGSTLEDLSDRLRGLKARRPPFLPDAELDKLDAQWVRPKLVAQVKFAQWTGEDRLRAPVFLGLRSDIDPRSVRRESEEAAISVESPASEPEPDDLLRKVTDTLSQLSSKQEDLTLEIAGHRLKVTNLGKELWPATDSRPAVTKRDMIRFYARMGPVVLPHLRGRPITLTRYPDGIHGESFYQKHWGHKLPEFVETVRLFSSHNEGDVEYIMANNLPTLIWLAQIADIELHPWLSRTVRESEAGHLGTTFTGSGEELEASVLNYPDFIAFDLDPYIYSGSEKPGGEPELNRRAFAKVVEVAYALKDILDQLSLSSFLKTSGKTGLHIYVPIVRRYDYSVARKTCELVGRFLMQHRPQDVTMEWTVSKRGERIFLDHNQNVRGKNTASIYSLRPLPGAPVSTPLRWDELDKIYPTDFTIDTVPDRVAELGDLWAGILESKHDLSRLLESAE